MTQTPEQTMKRYLSHFEVFEKSLNGESRSAVHDLRRKAIARFGKTGFPTTRDEEWRFTNVAPIAKMSFVQVVGSDRHGISRKDLEQFLLPDLSAHRMVLVNGRFSRELSSAGTLPKGVTIDSLANVLTVDQQLAARHLGRYATVESNPFVALGTAFLHDGVFIHVPDNTMLEHPVQVLFVSTGGAEPFVVHPRNLVLVGKQARLSVVESFVHLENNTYFNNVVSEIVVGEDSVVEFDRVQHESARAFHVGTVHVHQERGSRFVSNSVSFGGAILRNSITAVLSGEHGECTLNGLALAAGQQLVDNHTTIDHASPNCDSHELYKSILDGNARGVFNGKIFVRKDAQKTDAKQTNKTLLLSDEATIDTKPQLEIFADDVKCTHGATVGQLDEDQVFYLRSRGIGLDDARDLLTNAFASDVIDRIAIASLRMQLLETLHARLKQGRLTREV
ncbi:MAG: Fe-S cluster assembly protein SufD [Ignavibacteria bacterium]|nr:Fe-S cluster assembly protein SufD [Ignavibacteria bacterium]